MRIFLLSFMALATVFSSQAFNYKISGYGTTAGGYSDFSAFSRDNSNFDYFIDGRIAADIYGKYSQLTYGFRAEMETSYDFKEAYLYFQIPYFRVEAGRALNIAQKLHVGVFDASYSRFNNGSYVYKLIDNPNVIFSSSTAITMDDNSQKISLISGKFYGFQAGFSYAQGQMDGYKDTHEYYETQNNEKFDRAYGAGLRFNHDFGFYKLAASAGIGQMDKANNYKIDLLRLRDSFEKRTEYTSGLNLTAGNLTLSGAGKIIKEQEAKFLGSQIKDGYVAAGGLHYSFLQFAASASYQRSEMKINEESDIVNMYQLSLKYNPYKGFNIWLSTGYLEMYDDLKLKSNNGMFTLIGMTYNF